MVALAAFSLSCLSALGLLLLVLSLSRSSFPLSAGCGCLVVLPVAVGGGVGAIGEEGVLELLRVVWRYGGGGGDCRDGRGGVGSGSHTGIRTTGTHARRSGHDGVREGGGREGQWDATTTVGW